MSLIPNKSDEIKLTPLHEMDVIDHIEFIIDDMDFSEKSEDFIAVRASIIERMTRRFLKEFGITHFVRKH